MCEEIQNASKVVPWAMVFSIAVNGVLGLAMLIALLFCIGNIDNALESPTHYPFIEIFYQGVRNSTRGATAMVSFIDALLIFCCISLMAAASRMMWAFARDQGLPGSKYLARVCRPIQPQPLHPISPGFPSTACPTISVKRSNTNRPHPYRFTPAPNCLSTPFS